MWEKNNDTIKYDKSTIMYDISTIQYDNEIVKYEKKKKKKIITECDNSTIKCDVDIA